MDNFLDMTPTEREPAMEGPSFSLYVRVCGTLCFLCINPLFVWMWIDNPKFVEGAVDFPEIVMAIVTLGMLLLGCWGITTVFTKTRVYGERIEWGLLGRNLKFSEIAYVRRGFRFHGVFVMQLVCKDGRRAEIPGGTKELGDFFKQLAAQFPKT